ncbi:MAG: hypothetical protein E7096_09740 [Bacteroides sp.]|nr:hypothetical protein [Bacteroides sp.]
MRKILIKIPPFCEKNTHEGGFVHKKRVFDGFADVAWRILQSMNKRPLLHLAVLDFAEIALYQRLIRLSGLTVASSIFAIEKTTSN